MEVELPDDVMTRDITRHMCRFYHQDYVCFGYTPPTECADLFERGNTEVVREGGKWDSIGVGVTSSVSSVSDGSRVRSDRSESSSMIADSNTITTIPSETDNDMSSISRGTSTSTSTITTTSTTNAQLSDAASTAVEEGPLTAYITANRKGRFGEERSEGVGWAMYVLPLLVCVLAAVAIKQCRPRAPLPSTGKMDDRSPSSGGSRDQGREAAGSREAGDRQPLLRIARRSAADTV